MMKTIPWYHILYWFKPSTLKGFEWEHPLFLYGIPLFLLLALAYHLIKRYRRQKLPVAFSSEEARSHWTTLLRLVPPVFFFLALSLMFVSLARPQRTNEKVDKWSEGIDIMMALDISESMKIQDLKPNRLEAAKHVAENFIKGRFHDRIGMVIFAGEAYSLSPLTTDYNMLRDYIHDIDFSMIQRSGTAIGDAVGVCINRLKESDAKSKVIILATDGDSNAGNIDPITAAKLANAYGIKIYTISVGREGKVPFGKDFFGNTRYVNNSVDVSTLKQIADICDGRFFRAQNDQGLKTIFNTIDKLEKTEIKESRYKETKDFYFQYLKWACVFMLLWFGMKATPLHSALED